MLHVALRRLLVEPLEDRRLLATINLATLNASQGTILYGANGDDHSGFSVSNAGDVNGDGYADLLVGSPVADAQGNNKVDAGDSHLVFGGPNLGAIIDLNSLGASGVTIYGADSNDQSGFSVSGAGDVNGDGFDDFLIGAYNAAAAGNLKDAAGESYLIFGKGNWSSTPTIDLANLGSAGTTIYGANTEDFSGISVHGAGDVNGDGFDDILIGAYRADASGNLKNYAGDSYLIFGKANWSTTPTINLAAIGTAGVSLFGAEADDRSGRSVSGAGDVNGDGFDDLLIGAYGGDSTNNANRDAGESYLVFGKADWSTTSSIDFDSLGATGVVIYGVNVDDYSGRSVSGAGDVNGDGFDDFVIGAHQAAGPTNNRLYSGESYLIFGKADWATTPSIDLASLGAAGVTIFGIAADDRSGFSVSNAGDINADGYDDLLIGAIGGDGSANNKADAGESYVVFGKSNWSGTPTINLSSLANNGITIFGDVAGDISGISVSAAGDVDGDGFDDLLIGAAFADAPNTSGSKVDSGESYLLFGNNSFTSDVTHLGTGASETLTGTTGANIMVGGRGNDTLVGNNGADVLLGGQGNDILSVGNLSFRRIVGGTGDDMLQVEGSGRVLDLTSLADNRIIGIEQINMTGSGNNTLTLDYHEVLNISNESNTLVVFGNLGDVVNFATGWTQLANETIGSDPFYVYAQGVARLKIQAVPQASIAGRSIFYNNALGFGTSGANNSPAVNPTSAMDATRLALLPGNVTTPANYTNYSRGLNGIVVDLNNPGNLNAISSSSFQFATWSDFSNTTPNFLTTNPTVTVSTFATGGVGGSSRVKLVFADRAVENAWLQITVLANADTGLATDDVFYFGNARFDVTPTSPFPSQQVTINAFDVNAIRARQGQNPGVVSNIFDVDRNGVVNAFDTNAVRAGLGVSSLRSFTAPSPLQMGLASSRSSSQAMNFDSLFADTSWLDAFQSSDHRNRLKVLRF